MLDSTYLRNLASILGEPEILRELCQTFQTDTLARIQKCEEAWAGGDRPLLERLAHDLKTNAGNLGLRQFQAMAADLEHHARQDKGGGVLAECLKRLVEAHDRAQEALSAFLSGLPPDS